MPLEAELPTDLARLNSRVMKRAFDVLAATAGLVLLAPVMAIIAALVTFSSPGPVIFYSPRVGRYGRVFLMPKFRTMRVGSDVAPREALKACNQQITPIGRLLRRSGLDELPQLFCVLSGDMSLIGPRPLLPQYLPLYSRRQALRHQVMPGITGWAQVHGRNGISWAERLELDVWYVEHASPLIDLRILLRTIPQVLTRKGASPRNRMTMEPFHGSQK